jgi:hypothetical protein
MGGLAGMIFGVPTNPPVTIFQQNTSTSNTPTNDSTKASSQNSNSTDKPEVNYTNLTQISDWLTK